MHRPQKAEGTKRKIRLMSKPFAMDKPHAAKQVCLRSTDFEKSVLLIRPISPYSSKAAAFDETGADA